MNHSQIAWKSLSSLIVAFGLLCCAFPASAQQVSKTNAPGGKPLNEEATTAAWDAFNSGKYEAAITNAAICIDEFRGQANRLEAKLEADKVDLPSGEVSDEVKKKILANGVLNDVATCYFIQGRSVEKLGRKADATRAYELAKKFPHARTWDTKGWFWSPAEAASDRLETLK